MPGELTKDFVKRYTQQKENLQKHFLSEKVGKQALYIAQAELNKPIIDSQKETTENIQNKITNNQDLLTNTLVPFTNELKRRSDQVDELKALPYYNVPQEIEDIPQSTPKKDIIVDVNGELLNQTHIENLAAMNLELPSKVQEKGKIKEVLDTIKSLNRSLGQLTGITGEKKRTSAEREVYKSQKQTLSIYERKLKKLQGVDEFIEKTGEGLRKRKHKLCKQKRGKGRPKIHPDTIVYNTPKDLVQKLYELIIAKEAGNTGLDNSINSILDELLNIGAINKNDYDILLKNIFHTNK